MIPVTVRVYGTVWWEQRGCHYRVYELAIIQAYILQCVMHLCDNHVVVMSMKKMHFFPVRFPCESANNSCKNEGAEWESELKESDRVAEWEREKVRKWQS